MNKKNSLMESEEYIIFKNILYRKKVSISQFVNKYKTNRENIRRAFMQNKKGGKMEDKKTKGYILYEPKKRLERLKELSTDLRNMVHEKFPDMIEEEIDFLTSFLGKELKYFFKPIDKGEKESKTKF